MATQTTQATNKITKATIAATLEKLAVTDKETKLHRDGGFTVVHFPEWWQNSLNGPMQAEFKKSGYRVTLEGMYDHAAIRFNCSWIDPQIEAARLAQEQEAARLIAKNESDYQAYKAYYARPAYTSAATDFPLWITVKDYYEYRREFNLLPFAPVIQSDGGDLRVLDIKPSDRKGFYQVYRNSHKRGYSEEILFESEILEVQPTGVGPESTRFVYDFYRLRDFTVNIGIAYTWGGKKGNQNLDFNSLASVRCESDWDYIELPDGSHTRNRFYKIRLGCSGSSGMTIEKSGPYLDAVKSAYELQKFIAGLSKGWDK